ncbi:CLRN1 protein, partial [Polypterus senegalus]
MPSRQKQVIFCAGGVLSFASALCIAAAIGTQSWVTGTILCTTGAQLVNATGPDLEKFVGEINYGLFRGQRDKQCGLGKRLAQFSFFPDLMGAIPASLHVTVILFSVAMIVFSLVATGFFMFNAFGKPYETLHGPLGLYLWNFISCSCGCLVMILFASEVKINHLSEKIANNNENGFLYKTHSEKYDKSFWIIVFCFFASLLNILLIRVAGIQFPFQEAKASEARTGAADLLY